MGFEKIRTIPSPKEIIEDQSLPSYLVEVKRKRDEEIAKVFTGESTKKLLIIGPCSADNEDSVCDYISRLAKVQEQILEKILIIPRIYTNKPRTTGIGYKGMLHQPDPNRSENILSGIRQIRKLHLRAIKESYLTSADEMLYPENYEFLSDLLSYVAIGARSTENQQHRLVSSGLEIPVGMKNPMSGDLTVMLNSVKAAQAEHTFIYNKDEVKTTGNPLAHAILRGAVDHDGRNIPNYHYENLRLTVNKYNDSKLENPGIIVDTNHSNSGKKPKEQSRIAVEILHHMKNSKTLGKMIKGFMIESYIEEGAQKIGQGIYGKSITDPCLGWNDTENLILKIADRL